MPLANYNEASMSLKYARRVLNQEDKPLNLPLPTIDRNTLKRMAADGQWDAIGKVFGFAPKWTTLHGQTFFNWQSCNAAFWEVFCATKKAALTEGRVYLKAIGENELARLKITSPKKRWKPLPPLIAKVKKQRDPKRRRYLGTDIHLVSAIVWTKTRGRCFYCKKPLVKHGGDPRMIKDHFIPLISKGPDDHSNLVPACVDCDRLKGGKMPLNLPKEIRARYIRTA